MFSSTYGRKHRSACSGGEISEQSVEVAAEVVERLSKDTATIYASFEAVSHRLRNVNFKRPIEGEKIGEDLKSLAQKWDGLHQMFRDNIWASRDLASKASVVAEDFADNLVNSIILNDAISFGVKKGTLKAYIQQLNTEVDQAKNVVDSFQDLSKQVGKFKSDWEICIQDNSFAKKEATIKYIDKEIVQLRDKVKKFQSEISILNAILHFISYAYLIANLFTRRRPRRSTKPKPAHSGLCSILNKMSNQEAEHRLKLDKFQQRREIECAELDDLISLDAPNALDACLEECKSDFKNISTKVQCFSKLWTSIRSDLKHIENFLELASGEDMQGPNIYKERIQRAARLYARLTEIFQEYERAIGFPAC